MGTVHTQGTGEGSKPVARASWIPQTIALLALILWFGFILGASPGQAQQLGIWSWGLLAVGLGVLFVMRTTLNSVARSIVVALLGAGTSCMLVSYFVAGEDLVIGLRIAALVLVVLCVPLSSLVWLAQRLRRLSE